MGGETGVIDEIAHGDLKSRLKKTTTVEKSHLPTKDGKLNEGKAKTQYNCYAFTF